MCEEKPINIKMNSYELYNFDHGCKSPCEIVTDSFRIIINEQHCDNLNKIERNASTTFTLDEKFTPIIIENGHQDGSFKITGIIETYETDDKSYLYREGQGYQFVDDIMLVLSFLTGRRVYREEEIKRYSTKYYIDAPVSINQFTFRQIKKENIIKISELQLNKQFMNTVQSYSLNDLLSLTCYCSSTLDKTSNSWAKKHGYSKFSIKKQIKNLKKTACKKVIDSIYTDAKILFLKLLKENGCKNEIYKDIEARIIAINSSPSALYKLKKFLVSLNIYPENDSSGDEEKLRWLNTVRNSVVHNGDLPKVRSITDDMLSEVVANITFLMLGIIQLYFSKEILKISDYRLRDTEQSLRSYFKTGRFRGKDIFNETYKEYMDRIKDDWIQRKIT